jgi:hypothetical protein
VVNVIIKTGIVLLTRPIPQCLQQFPDFMGLEEEDLTQSKDTDNLLHLYEFEVICHMQIVGRYPAEAKRALYAWLEENTQGYTLRKFYLKKIDAWKDEGL